MIAPGAQAPAEWPYATAALEELATEPAHGGRPHVTHPPVAELGPCGFCRMDRSACLDKRETWRRATGRPWRCCQRCRHPEGD